MDLAHRGHIAWQQRRPIGQHARRVARFEHVVLQGSEFELRNWRTDIRRLMGEPAGKSAPRIAKNASPAEGDDIKRPLNEKPGGNQEPDPQLKLMTDPFPSGRIYSPAIFDLPTQINWQGAPS